MLFFLSACAQDLAPVSELNWHDFGSVGLDEPWAADGSTPAELAAGLTEVPGIWDHMEADAQTSDATLALPMTFSGAIASAREYRCEDQDGNSCIEPLLCVDADLSFATTEQAWLGTTDNLCWISRTAEWGFWVLDEADDYAFLSGPIPTDIAAQDACSSDYALRVRSLLRVMGTNLVARCADGTDQVLYAGTWVPDSER